MDADLEHDPARAGERALIERASKDRRIYRRVIAGLVAAFVVGGIIVLLIVLTVFDRFDQQTQVSERQACRAKLEAEYDEQQTRYLDALDARNPAARVATRENMSRLAAARIAVKLHRVCPDPELVPIPT